MEGNHVIGEDKKIGKFVHRRFSMAVIKIFLVRSLSFLVGGGWETSGTISEEDWRKMRRAD